jgi:hypothetical protein
MVIQNSYSISEKWWMRKVLCLYYPACLKSYHKRAPVRRKYQRNPVAIGGKQGRFPRKAIKYLGSFFFPAARCAPGS